MWDNLLSATLHWDIPLWDTLLQLALCSLLSCGMPSCGIPSDENHLMGYLSGGDSGDGCGMGAAGGLQSCAVGNEQGRAAACHRTERLMDDSGSEGDARHWSLRRGTLSGACAGLAPRLAREVPSYASELQNCAPNPGKRGLADRTVRTGNARWLTSPRDGWAAGLPPTCPACPACPACHRSAQTAGVGAEKQAQLTTQYPPPPHILQLPLRLPNGDWLAAPLAHFLPSSSLRSQSPQIASYQQVVSFLPSARGPQVPV